MVDYELLRVVRNERKKMVKYKLTQKMAVITAKRIHLIGRKVEPMKR